MSDKLVYMCPKCGYIKEFKTTFSVPSIVNGKGEQLEELDRFIFRSFSMKCLKCNYLGAAKEFSNAAENI